MASRLLRAQRRLRCGMSLMTDAHGADRPPVRHPVRVLAACLVAGMIVVFAVLFPEFSDLDSGAIDPERHQHRARLRLHLHQRLCAAAGDDRGADHRGVLHPQRAGLCARRRAWSGSPAISAWFRSIPPRMRFDGIVRRHLEIMTGAGIVGGLIYWMIAGRNAGAWREPRPRAAAAAGRTDARSFHRRPSSAKPPAMNRTGLFIALGLALVIGLLFGLYPELDLKLAALFYDPATKPFRSSSTRWRRSRATARCGSPGRFALPAIVALVVKLVRPDRPLLMSGPRDRVPARHHDARRGHPHQPDLQELLGPAAAGGGDRVQRRPGSSCRGGTRAASAPRTARSSPARAPPRSGPMRRPR